MVWSFHTQVELNASISDEMEHILRKLATPPQANHLGSKHHTLFIDTMDAYRRMRSKDSDVARRWSGNALGDFAQSLGAAPEEYKPTIGEVRQQNAVQLHGDLRHCFTNTHVKALDGVYIL